MEQISAILHLGGYGAYIWPAYGVAAAVLIGLLARSLATLRANDRLLARLQDPPSFSEPAKAPAGRPRHETAR